MRHAPLKYMYLKYQIIKILRNCFRNMNCFSWIKLIPVLQARNGIFQGRGVFWNQGTSINIHLQHKKERQGKNFVFIRLETLKKFILNEKFYPQMTTIRTIFFSPNQGTFFQFLQKSRGDRPPPLQLRACSDLSQILILQFPIPRDSLPPRPSLSNFSLAS